MKKTTLPLMFLGFGALLSACNSTPAPQASDQPTVMTISGKVASPSASGAGSISVPGVSSATAAVAADGRFSLPLPQASALGNLLRAADQVMTGLSCSGKLNSSDTAAKGHLMAALNLQDSSGSKSVMAVSGSKSGLLSRAVQGKVWLYTDHATRLTGVVDCARLLNISQISSLPVNVDVSAKAGWNVIDLNMAASANIFGQVSASGTAVNSATSEGSTVWQTTSELMSQVGF